MGQSASPLIGKQDSQVMRTIGLKCFGCRVWQISKFLCDLSDMFLCVLSYVLVIVQCLTDGCNRYTAHRRNILHRYHFHYSPLRLRSGIFYFIFHPALLQMSDYYENVEKPLKSLNRFRSFSVYQFGHFCNTFLYFFMQHIHFQ